MELYLVRHADALAIGEQGIRADADRPLSDLGRRQSAALAKCLLHHDIQFDQALTSPLLRARQTAEIVLGHWPKAPLPTETSALEPDAKPRDLTRALANSAGQRVVLFGHLPHIGFLASWLIGSKKARLDFTKAGAALITCDDHIHKGTGSLQWFVSPLWYGTE